MSKFLDNEGLAYFWLKIKALLAGKATVTAYTVSLPASGWSSLAPYTQTVSVPGILATDAPIMDVILSDTVATAMAQLEGYALIDRIDTDTGEITATCYNDKPTVNLFVALMVVK